MVVHRRMFYIRVLVVLYLGCVVLLGLTESINMRESRGICEMYNGTQCINFFNSTAGLRFINQTIGFNKTEKFAIDVYKRIYRVLTAEKEMKCRRLIENTACYYIFPPCTSSGEQRDYCREDCDYLFRICGGEFYRVIGAATSILQKQFRSIFRFDDCEQYKSQNDDPGSNNSCVHLPFLDLPPSKTSNKKLFLVLVIVIPLLCLFLLVVLSVCYRRSMNKNRRSDSVHYPDGRDLSVKKADRLANVVSMRDRIRDWKVAPSELIELVDICKSRGVVEIPVDDIEYLKDLGSGQYGLVFQGRTSEIIEGENSGVVAVKTLREGSAQEAIKEFCQEVNIMSTFSHPNVVRLIGVSLAGEPYCMIFEFVEFGDLANFLRKCAEVEDESDSAFPKLTVTDQMSMSLQIASGMKYISSIRCVHRDLAARNCLVGRGLVLKISDFGLSRDVYASEYYRMDKIRMLPVRWLPPEAFVDGKFTQFSDVYSYGVLLWEIFTFARLPYEEYDNEKAMQLILDGNLLERPEGCPSPVYDIMKKCWVATAEERITFPDIINELCSLDDYGGRFTAEDTDKIVKNYQGRMSPQDSQVVFENEKNTLSYTNNCFNNDEPPINVERLPDVRKKPVGHQYSLPMSDEKGSLGKNAYDGVVALTETAGQNDDLPRHVEGPQAIHRQTPPVDTGDIDVSHEDHGDYNRSNDSRLDTQRVTSISPLLFEDLEGQQETYEVPPVTYDDDEGPQETYEVPPIPPHRRQHRDLEEPQETYDIPPTSHNESPFSEELQETYDVPPTSHVPTLSLRNPQGHQEELQETYNVPPNRISRNDEGPQETYDVPPRIQENASDELYQNSANLKTGHYSVPQSPYLDRRNKNNDVSSGNNQSKSMSRKGPYENVDIDGKPLMS